MLTFGSDKVRDEVILAARLLLAALFIIFGWGKLTDFGATIGEMAKFGLPLPWLAALVALVMEVFVAIAIILGAWTRPFALAMAVYTLATGFIGHHYWTMTGAAQFANEINFYKNISIAGGFLLLYVTGAGRYSVDAQLGARRSVAPSQGYRPV